ncbi:thioesterase II [Lactarius psammicola]|nr:thioesterase II [Lactarius psammicola]
MADSDPLDHDQAEPSNISVALDNLFRPYEARGVFGGQVISQALVAATKCVKPEFLLHVSSRSPISFLAHLPTVPLLYYVDRLRDGRSYSTRSVRAMQGGRVVFVMLCSFQVPEIWQPSRHWPMPRVPRPEDCEDAVEYIKRMARQPNVTEEARARLLGYAKSREESPVFVKPAGIIANESEGRSTYAYWMKAETAKQHLAAFQKVGLSFSLSLIPLLLAVTGMKRNAPPGPKTLAMASSLDHSLSFYNSGTQASVSNDFDCGDWLLYLMTSPAAGMGRAVASGLLYSADGTLLATVNQEGVVRADLRRPSEETPQVKAKM